MLWIKDVPGFEFILFHPGNTDKDTDGCIIVGSSFSGNTLISSRDAYFKMYNKIAPVINSGKQVSLTIIDFDRS
jgi:hypothetical protein